MIQAIPDGSSAVASVRSMLLAFDVRAPVRLQRLVHDRSQWILTLSDPEGRRYEARVGEDGTVGYVRREDRAPSTGAAPRRLTDEQARWRARRWLRRLRVKGPLGEASVYNLQDGNLGLAFPVLARGRPFLGRSYRLALDARNGRWRGYEGTTPADPTVSDVPKLGLDDALRRFQEAFAVEAAEQARLNGERLGFEIDGPPELGYREEWRAPASLVWAIRFRLRGSSRWPHNLQWTAFVDAVTGTLRTGIGPFELRRGTL